MRIARRQRRRHRQSRAFVLAQLPDGRTHELVRDPSAEMQCDAAIQRLLEPEPLAVLDGAHEHPLDRLPRAVPRQDERVEARARRRQACRVVARALELEREAGRARRWEAVRGGDEGEEAALLLGREGVEGRPEGAAGLRVSSTLEEVDDEEEGGTHSIVGSSGEKPSYAVTPRSASTSSASVEPRTTSSSSCALKSDRALPAHTS